MGKGRGKHGAGKRGGNKAGADKSRADKDGTSEARAVKRGSQTGDSGKVKGGAASKASFPAKSLTTVLDPGPPLSDGDLPKVAIVILNYNGLHHLEGCFESLRAMDYPRELVEVVLVDNGSSDDSVETVRRRWPWVNLVANPRNVGFSAGCNQGAQAADDPALYVFLNNDMRVEPTWLRELVGPVVRGECVAATAKMLSWDGKLMNSAGGGMNFHGIGIQKGYLVKPGPEHDVPTRTLFACGGAMAVDADVFREVGGFDEEFFAYYEDVDLGWRMWVQGHEVHYAPRAVCYHHHSSTSRTFPIETVRLLQTRNPVLACFKNYDDDHLRQVMPAMFGLFLRRMLVVAGIEDSGPYRIERAEPRSHGVVGRLFDRARHAVQDTQGVRRVCAADLIGINDFLGNWDHWMARRTEVQAKRRRPDAEIFTLFHKPGWCIEDEPGYRQLHEGLAQFMGLDRLFDGLEAEGAEPHR
ncbi:glycosyltransferase family 2 protein [Engelhardtia mirabilis]|uniref:N-acetylglucosaminyl-diphospho-decaprenol L-rhamnosyltransferase n=1 Tax=Engelhardtia mirabilis TaxID=2528011 RepID=A0A518BJB9_9BACT|nr:N-acetylglucosaminyl-diphospho-decaprenol L-rhamnosyltransferase [Planctomycetes bacterium Pla133]QDV01404.1 N-acetylglucosaminyl-diphospho-decaprenol L-rhamnosyltransferase [Planctomycetes bacterium Pla86]